MSELKRAPKAHPIAELPRLNELDKMVDFCHQHKHLFILGAGEYQEFLLKFFDICNINIEGYAVSNPEREYLQFYRSIPIVSVENVLNMSDVGIIIGLSEKNFNDFLPMFGEHNFSDYFLMSEYNKRSIASQLTPRPKELLQFEVSLAEHCNISCQCCDHFAQLAKKKTVDALSYRNYISMIAEKFDHVIGAVTLLGGEPLLNDDIIEIFKITREQFPKTAIVLLTNGILFEKLEHSEHGNIWEAMNKYNIEVVVTMYPIKVNYKRIVELAEQYDVVLSMSSDVHAPDMTQLTKISDKHTMSLNGDAPLYRCVSCLYFNKFLSVKDGVLYPCPIASNMHIFNDYFGKNIELKPDDYLDLKNMKSWEEFSEFGAAAHSICGYCDILHWGHYGSWKPSTKEISEYV